ncbi:hypothetical protein DVH05_004222 [Phytophthora capsici]|nr:hypothetical protein DVH05_004222 [Phytophthora capsici]
MTHEQVDIGRDQTYVEDTHLYEEMDAHVTSDSEMATSGDPEAEVESVENGEVNGDGTKARRLEAIHGDGSQHIVVINLEVNHRMMATALEAIVRTTALIDGGEVTAITRKRAPEVTPVMTEVVMRVIALMTRNDGDSDRSGTVGDMNLEHDDTDESAMDHENGTIEDNATTRSIVNDGDRRTAGSDTGIVRGILKILNCRALLRHRERQCPRGLIVSIWH